jgi:hypothetical protein
MGLLQIFFAINNAKGPEILTMPIPPTPGGVAIAEIVSV